MSGALLSILNEKVHGLKMERERLLLEQRRLTAALQQLDIYSDMRPLQETLTDFAELARRTEGEKLQRLIRLAVKRIEWMPDGNHTLEIYNLPRTGGKGSTLENRLESNEWSDTPGRIRTSNQGIMSPLL
jgi:hypothetical protein